MSPFPDLLRQGAAEVREFCRSSPSAGRYGIEWLHGLARRMQSASALTSDAEIGREIDALARLIIDSGPLTEPFAPSFDRALDARQRQRKRGSTRTP